MKYGLVCFDMDGTLTEYRSSWCWVHHAFGVDNEESLEAFHNGLIDEPEFMRRDIALWKGIKPDVNIRDIAEIIETLPLNEGIGETISALGAEGAKNVIVSGGIDIAARTIAEKFGFDDYAADGLELYENGRLTGEGIVHVNLSDKGKTVREFQRKYGIGKERTVSVGNSRTDVSMFRESALSIAFNPLDEYVIEAADAVVRSKNLSDILDVILND